MSQVERKEEEKSVRGAWFRLGKPSPVRATHGVDEPKDAHSGFGFGPLRKVRTAEEGLEEQSSLQHVKLPNTPPAAHRRTASIS